jgi:riboflavin transporter FmnP
MNNTAVSEKIRMEQENKKDTRAARISTRAITATALLSALAFILAFAEFPVPFSPSFARMDFSDFPALIGAFAFGPASGVMIELVKNLLQLTSTSTGGIGELANFLMGGSFVFTAGLIYRLHKTKKTAWIAGIAGSVVMGIAAALSNYFILLPLFENFMPVDELIAAFEAYIPFIHTKLDVVLYNALPATTLKGLVITVFTMLVYKRIRPVLKGMD